MIEDRVKALVLALKAVLSVAGKQGLNLGEVSDAAADELLQYKAYDAKHVPLAIREIELAASALQGYH
jgi:hypothetical protein